MMPVFQTTEVATEAATDVSTEVAPAVSRRRFLRGALRGGLGLTGAVIGAGSWARWLEPEWVEITQHQVALPNLPRAFDGFRIAQISDIHLEGGSMSEDLPRICELVTRQNADAIVITGDFVTTPIRADARALRRGLGRLRAPSGVFGIMGNHDYFAVPDAAIVRGALTQTEVRVLANEVHVWQRQSARLHLAGFDDFWVRPHDFTGMAARIPSGEAAIALGHEPDFALAVAATRKFGLMLAGHSHGGQIALPLGRVIHVPQYAHIFPRGWYDVSGMHLYTNRGLGTVGIPMRFCARPEISVFTLKV